MTHKKTSDRQPLLKLRISTLLTIVFLTVAIICAALGFSKAGDIRVAPTLVSTYLFISGIFLAAQFVLGIRREERWHRAIAVISGLAAIFVVVMAIMFYQVLTQVKSPF